MKLVWFLTLGHEEPCRILQDGPIYTEKDSSGFEVLLMTDRSEEEQQAVSTVLDLQFNASVGVCAGCNAGGRSSCGASSEHSFKLPLKGVMKPRLTCVYVFFLFFCHVRGF